MIKPLPLPLPLPRFYNTQAANLEDHALSIAAFQRLLTLLAPRSTYPMTTLSSSGKSYSGTAKFSGAGPFLARPEMS